MSGLVVIGAYVSFFMEYATAQIIPDNTLGTESSVITPNVSVRELPASIIQGGALRGVNLFHSFQEFNVGEGQRVYFANPSGIENILSRITGTNPSKILGTLGVNGGANLFLLNPNGIIFGANARLDVAGSFFASTASHFIFPDGSKFSATNPQAPPLLIVNLKPGLQYGTSPQGATISSTGNLTTGQDLTLVADRLELQGQLRSGRDLTLQARDTLQIRDTVAAPFIATAKGQMVIQGDREVDISAINHQNSGFFSGKDMVLRANKIEGDAHYFSGGNFRIEQLNGSLGNLFSPFDPIVHASGNVSLNSYTGASLHILAGGSVTITGDVTIARPDTTGDALVENVLLSDGKTSVTINGNTQQTLDIRAGTTAFGTTGIAGATDGFSPLPETGGRSSGNISIGGTVINSGGAVFLTNQYQPNPTLSGGTISTQGIYTSTDLRESYGGNITIDARSGISTGNLNTSSASPFAPSGSGGAIRLLAANGNINAGSIDSYSGFPAYLAEATNISGDGGNVSLQAINGSITTKNIDTSTSSSSLSLSSPLPTSSGNGGSINIDANDNISTGGLTTDSFTQVSSSAVSSTSGVGGLIRRTSLR
ncbi:hypothetical protein NUACC26_072340 [Scytonema sp. NUACC26]